MVWVKKVLMSSPWPLFKKKNSFGLVIIFKPKIFNFKCLVFWYYYFHTYSWDILWIRLFKCSMQEIVKNIFPRIAGSYVTDFDPRDATNSFASMPYPGFEPGTFGVDVGSPIHYTNWSTCKECNNCKRNLYKLILFICYIL